MFAFKFIQLYHQDMLINFIYIWHDGRYRFIILPNEIAVLGRDLEVKVTEFSYKIQTSCIKLYIAIFSRSFD